MKNRMMYIKTSESNYKKLYKCAKLYDLDFILPDLEVAFMREEDQAFNSRGAGRKSKFSEEEKQDIFSQYKRGIKVEELAVFFNVSVSTISRIVRDFKKK